MTLTDETRLSQSEAALASVIDEQAVILDIDTGYLFQLNPVGSSIWWAIETPSTMPAICDVVRQEFNVASDVCRGSVEAFVQALLEKGLVKAG